VKIMKMKEGYYTQKNIKTGEIIGAPHWGVIARDKTITTELIRFYSKDFKNLGVNKILVLSEDLPRYKIQYEYFYLIFLTY
jgi:hypothetical protein